MLLIGSATLSAQINVSNDFESGLSGWSQTGGGSAQTDRACSGTQSFQDNVWSSSTTGSLVSPGNTNTTADEVTIDFTYKIQNFNDDGVADPYDGTVTYGYSLNGGATVNLGTLPPVAACTPISASIAAGTITAGDEIVFHFDFTWGTDGDWDVYVDDFSATQPGFCNNPTVTYSVIDDCANNQFSVDVTVTDAGNGTALSITDDQGSSSQAANLAGANSFGPYAVGTEVIFTTTNDDNAGCSTTSAAQISNCPPLNDECADAIDLVCNAAAISGTTVGASDNADDVGCTQGPSVWYSFVGTGLPVTITVDPTFDAEIGIATGSCGAFTEVDCDDGSVGTETFTFTPNNGVTYFVSVGHFSDLSTTTGTFTIELECETCTNPTVTYATVDDCANDQFSIEVSVTDPGTATSLTISDDQASMDQAANLTGPNTFGPYAAGTDVVFTVTNDQDMSCSVTSSTQSFSCPPPNDECADAEPLTIDVGTDGTISGATDSGVDLCGGTEDDDVWYSFVATATTHFVEIADRGTTSFFDFYHAVHSGTCGTLSSEVCSDPDNSTVTGLTIGETYYVQVYSWTPTAGQMADFTITVSAPAPPPVNDACADAIALTDASGVPTAASSAVYNTESADPAQSGPNASCASTSNSDDDIWFTVTAPNGAGDVITIEAEDIPGGTTVDLVIALYSGDCDNLVEVACADINFSSAEVITYLVPAARGALVPETFFVQAYRFGTGGGEFTVSASVALPVDLTSFTGQTMDKANKLAWITAREEAADRYVVERSGNASSWSAIGEVLAAGDSETELHYELMDESPLPTAYYRLKMVDLDGTFTFSNIVELTNGTLSNQELSVYPVPTVDQVTVSFEALAEGQAQILLTDLTGRTVSEQKVSVAAGQNAQTLDLQQHAAGIYLVRVNVDGNQMVRRVIKR